MEISEILALLGALGTIVGIISAFLGYKQGIKKEGANNGTLLTDVGYIKRSVDDLKHDQKEITKTIDGLTERVIRVEDSVRQLDERVDKHNSVIDRTYILKKQGGIVEEKIKVLNHRIEDLEVTK